MARQKEIFAIRKLKDQLPSLALLRDLIVQAMSSVDTKVADPVEKVAHYKILSGFQTRVEAQLAKLNSPEAKQTTVMKPLL